MFESRTSNFGSTIPFTKPLMERSESTNLRSLFKRFNKSEQKDTKVKFINMCKVFMYNYGSPRVGDKHFKEYYDSKVPRSYRVVVEGDVITTLPPPDKYSHIGTEILIDGTGSGSIIIEPNFVERWLQASTVYSSISSHSLLVYRRGLLGIKIAAEYAHLSDAELLQQMKVIKIVDRVAELKDENLISPGGSMISEIPSSPSVQNEWTRTDDIVSTIEEGRYNNDNIPGILSGKIFNKVKSIMSIIENYEKGEEDDEERS